MTNLIVIFVLVGAVAFGIYSIVKKRSKSNKSNKSMGESKPKEYVQFLSIMKTVFKGASKASQTIFLKENASKIDKFSKESIDFKNRFDEIIDRYGK